MPSPADSAPTDGIPPGIARVLRQFGSLPREEKMQALVSWAKKLEPVPERLASLDRAEFTVPECQTRVDMFAELDRGTMHYYADVNVRQSPTIAAFLSILLGAVNDQPPEVLLAIPDDFVPRMMAGIGLHTREVGLNAMLQRLKRHAREAQAAEGSAATPPG